MERAYGEGLWRGQKAKYSLYKIVLRRSKELLLISTSPLHSRNKKKTFFFIVKV